MSIKHCNESERVQGYLDGEFEASEAHAFEAHLEACAVCGAEVRLYRTLFARLGRTARFDPGPMFTERVLAAVLPARVRHRWVRVAGWAYAASFAVSLAAATVWIAQPATQEAVGRLTSGASGGIVTGLVLLFDAMALAMRGAAGGWEFAMGVVGWFAPITRATLPIVTHPLVVTALAAAGVASSAMLWSLRARGARSHERTDHVAILGF